MQRIPLSDRLLGAALTAVFFTLIWLYTREFRVFTNTIGIRGLVFASMAAGALAGAGILYALRHRLTPWERHLPEWCTILTFSIIFAPLLGSRLNRTGSPVTFEPFTFVSEKPFLATGYGIIKGEKIKPSGYRLQVEKGDKLYRFQYKKQPYFPLTKPGETVLLPVRTGWLGFRVIELQ
ncbi:MAG: hypothetical protein IPH12_04480 [Saprospirales bacterium]|nr:hypothetical protein [Saprospirales bacterium]MBK8920323.1 hypothetical protein [Saprospirales bacterium]